jgi:SAM-dependent methyltransferase
MNITEQQVAGHLELLEQRVFDVHRKWPQFKLLLADCREMAAQTPAGAMVVCLERTLLYGGISLFAPLFHRQQFISVDCSPASAEVRGAYNKAMVEDPRCVAVALSVRGQPEATGLPDCSADLLMIPNLVHHVGDQRGMFAEVCRLLKPGGRGYIFEPLVRELHQAPDDYLRYTPFGLERVITEAGMVYDHYVPVGGPFTAVAYCWQQALEYFPEPERTKMEQWFQKEHLPQLLAWEGAHPVNLKRQHTTFPTAFAVHFHRPA